MALTLPSLWTTLDNLDDAELYDTAEEAAAFAAGVRAEAEVKVGTASGSAVGGYGHAARGLPAGVGVEAGLRRDMRSAANTVQVPGGINLGRDRAVKDSASDVTGLQSSRLSLSDSTFAHARSISNDNAQAADFDRSFLPSFHASHIQYCSTPFDLPRPVEDRTRASVLVSPVIATGGAARANHQRKTASSPTSPASALTAGHDRRTRLATEGSRQGSRRAPEAGHSGTGNAEAGPGPSTVAARSRGKFSKVVSAPALRHAPAIPPPPFTSNAGTNVSPGRPAHAAPTASTKGTGSVLPSLGMTRRQVIPDRSLSLAGHTTPTRAAARSHTGSSPSAAQAQQINTMEMADTSLAPSLAEAPSRTLIPTTPLPSTPTDPRPAKAKRPATPALGALTRAGQTGMSIDIPPVSVGDVTHTPIVASPVDTPTTEAPRLRGSSSNTGTGTGHANRDAATGEVAITPLGNAKLRAGKSFLSLTKHFEAFTKALNKPEKTKGGRGRAGVGRAASAALPAVAAGAEAGVITGIDASEVGQLKKTTGDAVIDAADVPKEPKAALEPRFSMVPLGRSSTMVAAPTNGVEGVLSGCRFCIPPDHAGLSKHKHRWDIIVKLGGAVVLEPDTAVTHIIYEGRAPGALARELGLGSLDDLPEGCVCVKWEWVANCKLQSCKLDTGPYLSFGRKASGGSRVGIGVPTASFRPAATGVRSGSGPAIGGSRASSRLFDITDQLKGVGRAVAGSGTTSATGIRKRREATASDSETESSNLLVGKRIRSSPIQLQRQPIRPRTASSPANMGDPTSRPGVGGVSVSKEIGTSPTRANGKERQEPTVATDHGPATRPEWNDGGTQDGLDIMISGVQSGKVDSRLEDDRDISPDRNSADPTGHTSTDMNARAKDRENEENGNPCPMADRFKCGQAHDGSPKSPDEHPNEWLAKKFDDMHEMYSGAKHKNDWQIRGYRNAAAAMRRTKWPITSGAQAITIKGIGTSMKDRIDEFISGRPGRQFYDMDEQMQAVSAFAKIYGVGKHQANDLYTRGARTLSDLSAPSNPYNLSTGQLTGVALYDDLNTRIPRAECKAIFDLVRMHATRIDTNVWIEIMGSYRRGAENSGDVDILITRDTEDGRDHAGVMRRLVGGLVERGVITHELSCPHDWHALEAKWMGVCKLPGGLHRRIDILCIPFEQWGAALLYFTGNDIFNRSLRLYARKMGYSLNQRGLSKNVIRGKDGLKFTEGEIVASRTEQEIFDRLGLRWRPPHQRRP